MVNISNLSQTLFVQEFQSFCKENSNNSLSIQLFFKCYAVFARISLAETIFQLCLGLSTIFTNLFLIYGILRKRADTKFIFDKILFTHSIVNFMVGFLDFPFYHVFHIFGFWPFNRLVCTLWSLLDTTLNTVTILHMLYMSWTRIRSLTRPKTYFNEKIIKYPYSVSVLTWLTGVCIWLPINFSFIYNIDSRDYPENTCVIKYKPNYLEFILTLLTWFAPLIIIVFCTGYVMRILYLKNRFNSKHKYVVEKSTNYVNSNSKRNKLKKFRFRFDAQAKLSILIVIYLAQWVPSCFLWMINSLCSCIPEKVSTFTYWLTFSVAFTDALLVLLLNPNYSTFVCFY